MGIRAEVRGEGQAAAGENDCKGGEVRGLSSLTRQ